MEKQNKIYLGFAILSLTAGISITTIDLLQAKEINHFTMLGYLLAALFISLFITYKNGLFKTTFCLGCTLAFILTIYGLLLVLKADSLSLRIFRIVFHFIFLYVVWIHLLKNPWEKIKNKKNHITCGF